MNFEPPKCFGRTPRRQNSNEALNKEMIDILMMKNDLSIEPRVCFNILKNLIKSSNF